MKKTLTAAAVLGIASGTGSAIAQSSQSFVKLYGVADAAIGKSQSTGDTKIGLQTNSLMNNHNSVIGLKGSEDLGGGSWIAFTLEAPITLSTGVNESLPASFWSRGTWITIGNTNFGSLQLGRNWSASFVGQYHYELTGFAKYSVLARTFGYSGGWSDPWTNAQIKYESPSFGGLWMAVDYVPKADGSLLSNGVANQSDRWDAVVMYDKGPIDAAFTANQTRHPNSAIWVTDAAFSKVNYSLGGRYKFGNSFALAASYNRANAANSFVTVYAAAHPSAASQGRRYGFELGGSVFWGPFTITVDLTRDTTTDLYGGHKYTNGLLEGRYALSQHSFLYAAFLRLDGDNNYSLGIRHNF